MMKPVRPTLLRRTIVDLLRKRSQLAVDSDPTPRPFELAMAALREGYRVELPSKLDELASLAEQSITGHDAASLRTLVALAHRLRGTAGSYGFVEAGELAGEIEDAAAAGTLATAWPRTRDKLHALRTEPA
jgi:HPt (histidine-containing phosphotransfer) domain-containing protein